MYTLKYFHQLLNLQYIILVFIITILQSIRKLSEKDSLAFPCACSWRCFRRKFSRVTS